MGKTFQKIHGCSVGNFESNTEKIPQWIKANGGQYSKDITDQVTHLITTKEAYKKNVDAVKEAKRLRTVKIVTYDWLEDSLLSKNRRPKNEKPYLLETIFQGDKKKKGKAKEKDGPKRKRAEVRARAQKAKKRKGEESDCLDIFENSCLSHKTKMEAPVNYHLYTDKSTYTTYSATLVRPRIFAGHKERYILKANIFTTKPPSRGHSTRVPIEYPHAQQIQVFESNSQPHAYAAYVKYSRVGASATDLLAPLGSKLDIAMKAFRKFFKLKTGREWDERIDEMKPLPPKVDDEGKVLPAHEGWYAQENQMGILASFLRLGPVGGGNDPGQRDDGDTMTGSVARSDVSGKEREEERVSDTRDKEGDSGEEREGISSVGMVLEPDEVRKHEGDISGDTGSSMDNAIVID